jgi:hypothetical protein
MSLEASCPTLGLTGMNQRWPTRLSSWQACSSLGDNIDTSREMEIQKVSLGVGLQQVRYHLYFIVLAKASYVVLDPKSRSRETRSASLVGKTQSM